MDLERLRLHHYEHQVGREEEVCRCGHEEQDHMQLGTRRCFLDDCSCLSFDPSPPEPDYDAIFERRREERYFG